MLVQGQICSALPRVQHLAASAGPRHRLSASPAPLEHFHSQATRPSSGPPAVNVGFKGPKDLGLPDGPPSPPNFLCSLFMSSRNPHETFFSVRGRASVNYSSSERCSRGGVLTVHCCDAFQIKETTSIVRSFVHSVYVSPFL